MVKRLCSPGKAFFDHLAFLKRMAIFRSSGKNEFEATIKANWCEDAKDLPFGDLVCSTFASGIFVSDKVAAVLKEHYPNECVLIPVEIRESSDVPYYCLVCRFDADHNERAYNMNIFVTSDCPGIVVSGVCLSQIELAGVSGLDVHLWQQVKSYVSKRERNKHER
ncbi:hypothetical protein HAQ01_05055 [Acidithiobacillus thiooxidans]|nr:hypothetical protein [Acidithiobacillus thiooxidans]MBU2741852.1 hypothetical protein [Acidithiobacillus albertensis]MBU2792761.1 hypothetical protein [Acidithiobacillus thiooxidans]